MWEVLLWASYEVREPADEQWGVSDEEGHFTGIVGSLEREKGDLSMVLTPTPDRLQVMDHSRIYGEGAFVIISLKPQPPVPTWAFVESFTGNVEPQDWWRITDCLLFSKPFSRPCCHVLSRWAVAGVTGCCGGVGRAAVSDAQGVGEVGTWQHGSVEQFYFCHPIRIWCTSRGPAPPPTEERFCSGK